MKRIGERVREKRRAVMTRRTAGQCRAEWSRAERRGKGKRGEEQRREEKRREEKKLSQI